MKPKTLIWIGLAVGSGIGSYIPALWGEGLFSMASVLLGALGGAVGIWAGFKISRNYF